MIRDRARDLARRCNDAHASGLGFPTIWRTVLKGDALVLAGIRQTHADQEPVLEVDLITGQRLRFGRSGFTIV
ncbi:MAG TPA: hypothetical protein VGH03_06990 [Caulobacteraceae bacterium]|jgi:hypothetical protein